MSAAIEIRPMKWWDIEAVHDLEVTLFPHDCWTPEQFWAELAQPTRQYWVACDNNVVVGYAGVFCVPPDCDVQTIAVDGASQGAGIGKQLLATMVEYAMQRGCDGVLLEVRARNASARALYEQAGFVVIHTRKAYYPDGEDALILRKELTAVAHE